MTRAAVGSIRGSSAPVGCFFGKCACSGTFLTDCDSLSFPLPVHTDNQAGELAGRIFGAIISAYLGERLANDGSTKGEGPEWWEDWLGERLFRREIGEWPAHEGGGTAERDDRQDRISNWCTQLPARKHGTVRETDPPAADKAIGASNCRERHFVGNWAKGSVLAWNSAASQGARQHGRRFGAADRIV
jgi:hypothetical protein